MKFRLAGLGFVIMAGFAPLLASAEDAPIPKPRRPDRMPADRVVQVDPQAPAATSASTAPDSETGAAGDAVAALAKIDATPRDVVLQARITDGSADIPDGLTWRVFETKASANGDLILAGKSDDATAHFQLPPGNYVVHVAYGRAQTTDTISVGDGPNDKELVLDAGALRLNAAVVGDVPIPINQLRFDIFLAGSEDEKSPLAQNLSPNDIVTLNAGTYRVVSHFGDVNAVVRAELRVEPGQMTEATIYHKAAQVSFKLVSVAGGEAIADIDWSVMTPGGDSLYSYSGTFPATVLAEGDYIVVAKRGETAYQREFQVGAGAAQEIEVLTTVTDQQPART